MKTNEQIKNQIKRKYQFALKNRDMWQLEELNYLNENKKSKANQIHAFVEEYQTRMNVYVEMYMYVMDMKYNSISDAIRDLQSDAE